MRYKFILLRICLFYLQYNTTKEINPLACKQNPGSNSNKGIMRTDMVINQILSLFKHKCKK